jgi:ribosome modulation factor
VQRAWAAKRGGGTGRGRLQCAWAGKRGGGTGRAGDRARGRGNGIAGRARGRDIAIWRDAAARQYWLATESDAERDGESEVEEELLDSVSMGFMFFLPSE